MIQEYSNIIEHLQMSAIDPFTAVAVGSSLLKGIGGLFQSKSAKKQLRGLKDPGYQIPEGFRQNLAQAEQMARQGMPSQEYNLATTNIQRGTQAGLRQLSRMSNPFAGIAGLARTQTDALSRLDAQNAAIRRQNVLQAMGARRELAGQELAKQQYAQQQYMNAVNQANALRGAGIQNTYGAIDMLGMIGIAGMEGNEGGSNKTMGDKYNQSPFAPAKYTGVNNVGYISTPKTLPGYTIGR